MDTKTVNAMSVAALFGSLRIDQIAFACHSDEQEAEIKAYLGLSDHEWTEDECVAFGMVGYEGTASTNRAKLLFNYDLGIEVEILRYLGGVNYLDHLGMKSGVCHIGMHVAKGSPLALPESLDALFPAKIVQQVRTQTHTNEFLLASGRRYRYTIYDTTAVLGTCLKVIERIEHDRSHD